MEITVEYRYYVDAWNTSSDCYISTGITTQRDLVNRRFKYYMEIANKHNLPAPTVKKSAIYTIVTPFESE